MTDAASPRPSQDPAHVGIDRWLRPPEREAGDRACRVRADAGQGAELRGIFGQIASVPRHHLAGRQVETPGSRVVSHSLPGLENLVEAGGGERRKGGEAVEEPLVVRGHRPDARLLCHHLPDPHAIRIGLTAPGHVAIASPVPRQQPVDDQPRVDGTGLGGPGLHGSVAGGPHRVSRQRCRASGRRPVDHQ